MTKKTIFSLAAILGLATFVLAAATTVVVTDNTAAWTFNPDSTNATPYHFTTDKASIGSGSLFVEPISSTDAARKFIAANSVNVLVSDFVSYSYDFEIAGSGSVTAASKFYLNLYTKLPNSTASFYDCRYDYTPTIGSTTSFTTFTVMSNSVPSDIGAHATCPATLGQLPAGSTIFLFAINAGDTSLSDAGLAGYFDNVVLTTSADSTTYDFEPVLTPHVKNQCKNGGWMTFNTPFFKNQGDCVSFTNNGK